MEKNKPAFSEPNPGVAASGKFSLMLLNESEQVGTGRRGGRRKAFS